MKHPLLALALGLAAVSSLCAAAPDRPNVLFICVDDLKPLLGCYGDLRVKTPNIDRLAAGGTIFERAYCNIASCAPSRISLVTGMRPSTLGIYDLATVFRVAAPDAVTLPQYFKKHGWRTDSVGKVMHDKFGHEYPVAWSAPHWYPPAGLAEHVYALPENREQKRRGLVAKQAAPGAPAAGVPPGRGPAVEQADVPDTAYSDGLIAEEAIERLRAAQAAAAPFFMAVGFIKPHLPFCAPRKYWELYDRAAFVLPRIQSPPHGVEHYTLTRGEVTAYTDIPVERPLPDAKQRELIHGYHAAVSYVDAQIGKVLDELERLQLASRTIVVPWGDHGWHLGDHGFWGKATNFEEATRIPLIVRAPGVGRHGGRTQAMVETVDIFPTLTELADLGAPSVPQALEGRSFAAAINDPSAAGRAEVFHSFSRSKPNEGARIGHAVRTATHRLVEWKQPGAPAESADLELYDYMNDPEETANLALEQPATVARLRALLAAQPAPKPQIRARREER
jgi:iduronate 2-sulfatase